MSLGSPSARRRRVIFDCTVLRRVSTSVDHTSSIRRSVRTTLPASIARRTSSSALFPPGTVTGWPSRQTRTGPSTPISSTPEVYGRGPAALSRCQRGVSAGADDPSVPDLDPAQVLHRLAVGDPSAIAEILERSRASDDATMLVVAALFAPDGDALVARAARRAVTTRERQTVAIAAAHLRGDRQLVDALARDHLIEHPDSVLVAWIAGAADRKAHTDHASAKETP